MVMNMMIIVIIITLTTIIMFATSVQVLEAHLHLQPPQFSKSGNAPPSIQPLLRTLLNL